MPLTPEDKATLIHNMASYIPQPKDFCCGMFSRKVKHPFRITAGWRNFSRSINLPGAMVVDIENSDILQILMKEVHKLNVNKDPEDRISIRVSGGGRIDTSGNSRAYSESFSFTPCVTGDIIIRLVGHEFQEVALLDEEKKQVRVGSGVQIGDLNRILYAGVSVNSLHKKVQLCLPTSSLVPYVTFVGLADNSGHGTGIKQPSISGLIRAITFCCPDGEIIRIDAAHKDFETIRAGYFSLFGVVLNVEIECMAAKKLQSIKEARTMQDFIQEVKDGLIQNNAYVSAMYIPTYDSKGSHASRNVVVMRWDPVSLDSQDSNMNTSFSHFGQDIAIKFSDRFHVAELLRAHSRLIPNYMKYIVSKVEVGDRDGISVGPWPEVAHYQTAFPRNIDDADYIFTVKNDGKRIITALEKVDELLAKYAEKKQYPVIDAIYLRFYKGTNGGLSTSFHEEDEYVCAFDIVSDPHIPGYVDFKKEVQEFFMTEMQARPHWGKTVPENTNFEALYGKGYTNYSNALKDWCTASGIAMEKNPFLNKFFCNILKLPFAASLLEEKQEELQHPPVLPKSKVAIEHIADHLVDYIQKCETIDGETVCSLKLKKSIKKAVAEKPKLDSGGLFTLSSRDPTPPSQEAAMEPLIAQEMKP